MLQRESNTQHHPQFGEIMCDRKYHMGDDEFNHLAVESCGRSEDL